MQYTPQSILRWNRLDDIGAMLDVARNPDESNADYRQRILHTYVERASSTYGGLINSMNVEFGLTKFMTIQLTSTIADYSVYVTASRVILTAGSITEIYDYRYTQDNGYVYSLSLGDLCDSINTSAIWGASVDASLQEIRCDCLMIQSNVRNYTMTVPATGKIVLDHSNVVSGTVAFNEKDIFKIEIPFDISISDPFTLLTVDGDYTIDYTNGVIYSRVVPRGYGMLYCQYKELPYTLVGTSCNVYSFADAEFLDSLYMQYIGDEYTPSHDLLQYIRQLYVASNQTWGI